MQKGHNPTSHPTPFLPNRSYESLSKLQLAEQLRQTVAKQETKITILERKLRNQEVELCKRDGGKSQQVVLKGLSKQILSVCRKHSNKHLKLNDRNGQQWGKDVAGLLQSLYHKLKQKDEREETLQKENSELKRKLEEKQRQVHEILQNYQQSVRKSQRMEAKLLAELDSRQ